MSTIPCVPCCTTPQTTNIPGPEGSDAFTFITVAGDVVPALGNQVTVDVTDSTWMAVGQTVFLEDAGFFTVIAKPTEQSVTLEYQNIASNTASGNPIAIGDQLSPGAVAQDGADGVSSFTVTTAAFVVPAQNANVSNPDGFIHVADATWMAVGQHIFVSDGTDFGTFQVVSKTATTFVAKYLKLSTEASAGVTIGSGAAVTPGGNGPVITSLPASITDNSTGTSSATIAAGAGVATLTIPLTSLATGLSTLAIDLLTDYTVGYSFKLLSFAFVTTIVGAGAGASQVFNLEIGSTNTTGGVLTVTLASTDTIGEVTTATAITAANTGSASATLSIEMAAGGTVFTSGSGYFVIRIQNMDTADAVATLTNRVNALIVSLT